MAANQECGNDAPHLAEAASSAAQRLAAAAEHAALASQLASNAVIVAKAQADLAHRKANNAAKGIAEDRWESGTGRQEQLINEILYPAAVGAALVGLLLQITSLGVRDWLWLLAIGRPDLLLPILMVLFFALSAVPPRLKESVYSGPAFVFDLAEVIAMFVVFIELRLFDPTHSIPDGSSFRVAAWAMVAVLALIQPSWDCFVSRQLFTDWLAVRGCAVAALVYVCWYAVEWTSLEPGTPFVGNWTYRIAAAVLALTVFWYGMGRNAPWPLHRGKTLGANRFLHRGVQSP